MGWIAVGMGRLSAPFKSLIRTFPAGEAELSESVNSTLTGAFFFAPALSGFILSFWAGLATPAFFRLSSLAIVSASHAALTPPRDAFLLLCHSAEPSSPAI